MTERKLIHMVYTYAGFGTKLQHVVSWMIVTPKQFADGELSTDVRIFNKLKGVLGTAKPGSTYTVEGESDGEGALSILVDKTTYAGMWPDKEQVLEWAAIDVTYRTQLDLEARRKKDMKVDRLLEGLEPIQRAYYRMRGNQRRIFLALVVERIARIPK